MAMSHGFPASPMDKQFLEIIRNGKKELIPALDKEWVKPMKFLEYEPFSKTVEVDQWLEKMKRIQEDLQWLLGITYHRFWSQVVYDEGVHHFLDSYLRCTPRFYDMPIDGLNDELRDVHNSVHQLFFMVFLRLSVFRETEILHMSPAVFGDMLYDNFVFDIPKLMDICVLYGQSNRKLCGLLVTNVFKCQQKYVEDLESSISDIGQAFASVLDSLNLSDDLEDEKRSKAGGSQQSCNGLGSISLDALLDVSYYLVDCCCTLLSFMENYPPCVPRFHHENFADKIASFYEAVIPCLTKELKRRKMKDNSSKKLVTEVMKHASLTRITLLKIFHLLVSAGCINPVLESADVETKTACCEEFLEIITECLPGKTFIVDYQKRYPISEDLYLFRQAEVQIDENRTKFLEKCVEDIVEASRKEAATLKNSARKSIPTIHNGKLDNILEEVIGATAHEVTGNQHTALISQVKELLPHLEDKFIKKCLKHYKYNTEDVINAVLEDMLHPSLQISDVIKEEEKLTILSERKNIFDYDEFDVFHRDVVDVSKIHKGKKQHTHKDAKSLLDDKDEHLKSITREYEYKVHLEENMYMYEDEYDDTYDDPIVGTKEDQTADELLAIRPFRTPRIFEDRSRVVAEEWSDEEPAVSEVPSTVRSQQNFIEDPAVIRERLAASRRGGRGGHRDVKGRPKGHGQDEGVLRNRAFKEKNKTFRGNHNRRAMSDRKRRGGMIPS